MPVLVALQKAKHMKGLKNFGGSGGPPFVVGGHAGPWKHSFPLAWSPRQIWLLYAIACGQMYIGSSKFGSWGVACIYCTAFYCISPPNVSFEQQTALSRLAADCMSDMTLDKYK